MSAEARLASLGIVLPTPPKPVAAYIPARRSGNLLFISGQIPTENGSLIANGVVGQDVALEAAQACARRCAINALAIVKDAVGLAAVRQVVRVGVFVACGPAFTDQSKVGNGASELLVEVFGEAGRHARAAVGCSALPLGAPVEVEFVFEVA